MSEKTLKFGYIVVNIRKFHKLKQPINLDLISIDRILISNKFKHNDDGFNYFICYKEDEIFKPLCIILPQMSGYINNLKAEEKHILWKYNEIWNKIFFNEKYIKAKVREFNDVIKANFLGDKIPKQNWHYTCIACITINSVMRMKKKELSPSLFRIVQVQNKENKDVWIHKHWIRVTVIVEIWHWIRPEVRVRIWLWIKRFYS